MRPERRSSQMRLPPWVGLPGLGLPLLFCLACGETGGPLLTAEMPLHLEDHLDAATVVGSEVPADLPEPVVWSFDDAQPDWKVLSLEKIQVGPSTVTRIDDGLRLSLGRMEPEAAETWVGGVFVDLPDWNRDDWASVHVRARTPHGIRLLGLFFNVRPEEEVEEFGPFMFQGDTAPVVSDGTVQTYSLRADWSGGQWEGTWRQLILLFFAGEPSSVDLLSVTATPKESRFADARAGVGSEVRGNDYRRVLYTHTPGRVEYQVRMPEAGRLDLGMGVVRDDAPVTFRVTATDGEGDARTLFEEAYGDPDDWAQRWVDLSPFAGQSVLLTLEAESERPGTVAMWSAPTVTGAVPATRPNVIFYVIDGAGADYLSVYGYNRRTTPNLQRLAAEGALFEHVYSNSTWTKPSTASFMTSLQNSVLGGQTGLTDPVPEQVLTMAQHMHRASYQTGVFVANPNAGTLSDLQRGVDEMRESWEEFTYFGRRNHKQSSRYLNQRFWEWREAYPGTPFWVHFQATDIHRPQTIPAATPFAGLFVGPDERKTWLAWNDSMEGNTGAYSEKWEETGIDRIAYYTVWQALYDESMAHNDYQIGRLVERLKAEGEWENTLLVVGADHSIMSAGALMGLFLQDSLPPRWSRPMFHPSISRIPLLFIWPGHIVGGQRFSETVSNLDVLPTILDLVDLPMPEVMMGQSLAPLLLGTGQVEHRPVILDEFWRDAQTDTLRGTLEVVDGRWGASLEINPEPPQEDEDEEVALWRRPVPLLVYDLWNDPMCLHSLHEERPDLVEKYTAFLEAQWAAHQALARRFTPGEQVTLTPEQLEMLRTLGYIR